VGIWAAAHGDARGEYDGVASLYLPIALAVTAVVFAAVAYAAIRYRARPGNPTARPTSERKGVELTLAALLAAIVAVLVVTTFSSQSRILAKTPPRSLKVNVTSFRWGWQFQYANGAVSRSAPEHPAILRVPAGALVHFTITSLDVIHAFWIPDLKYKHDLFPYRTDHFDLSFPKQASFLGGRCTVFCGLKHADMTFSVVVMAPRDFDAWLSQHGGGA
jgi:cytochrome c oxidase subunit 2